MARTVTVAQMISRLDTILNIQNDTNVTEAEKITALNAGYAKFWDYLIDADLPDYCTKTVTVASVPGQIVYPLTGLAADFYKVRNLYVLGQGAAAPGGIGGNAVWVPIPQVAEWEIQSYIAPQVAKTVRLDYIQTCPVLTATTDVVDGINGWEDLIICYAAMEFKSKRDEDPGMILRKAQETERRITKMAASRDRGQNDRVIRRNQSRNQWPFWDPTVSGYRIRGDNLEMYYYNGMYVPFLGP